jgi:hypothetical protein
MLTISILLYVSASFITLETNPFKWDIAARFMVCLLWGISLILACVETKS